MKNISRKIVRTLIVLAVMIGLIHVSGFRINVTDSLPLGVYRLSDIPPERGDLVAFNLPEDHPYLEFMRSRKYPPGLHARKFLKRLVAVPGDDVRTSDLGILVNGQLMPNSLFRREDSRGNLLPCFLISGEVPDGQALVLSGHHPRSFDGRYFGLLDLDDLQRVTTVFIF